MPAFNGNYFDEEGQLRNLDGGFVNGDGWVNGQSPFNGAFIGSDGEVHNLSELSGGGGGGGLPPGTTTNNIPEGSNNKYYTQARIDEIIASLTTDAITEGTTNLYCTDENVLAVLPPFATDEDIDAIASGMSSNAPINLDNLHRHYGNVRQYIDESIAGFGGDNGGNEPNDDKELTFSIPPMYTREVEFKGIQWDEYFIDQSCTIASSSPVFVDVWMCGGGGSGTGSTTSTTGAGGGGGYILYCDNYPIALPTSIHIGEGGVSGFSGQATSLGGKAALGGMAATTNDGGAGGSGGGGARTSAASAGSGIPANEYTFYYPFGDVENFSEGNPVVGPLCAGGGGSTGTTDAKACTYGGAGGSNGSDGETGGSNSNDPALFIAGGLGGAVGGGHGGGADRENNTPEPGTSGTNYGAGGGGGARTRPASTGTYVTSAGGDGYQGCVIIRVPKK